MKKNCQTGNSGFCQGWKVGLNEPSFIPLNSGFKHCNDFPFGRFWLKPRGLFSHKVPFSLFFRNSRLGAGFMTGIGSQVWKSIYSQKRCFFYG